MRIDQCYSDKRNLKLPIMACFAFAIGQSKSMAADKLEEMLEKTEVKTSVGFHHSDFVPERGASAEANGYDRILLIRVLRLNQHRYFSQQEPSTGS